MVWMTFHDLPDGVDLGIAVDILNPQHNTAASGQAGAPIHSLDKETLHSAD